MLGIDVSKATLVCTLVDSSSLQKLWSRSVPNTQDGVRSLLKDTPPAVDWVLEPTGRYSQTVVRIASDAGRRVLLAEPRKAKAFLASLQSRVKTDLVDSYGLARYALAASLSLYPLKSLMVEQLDQLLCARKGLGQAIASLQQRRAELPHAATHLQASLKALKEQRKQLDKEITTLTAKAASNLSNPSNSEEATALACLTQALQQVPGIGHIVATTVASRLISRHFERSDQFVAYCGLDVSVRESGLYKGQGSLTKQGDGELRRLLYLAAQASLRATDSPFKAQYDREREKGMSSTAALCAVARKMARLCWALATTGQTYDPARIYQQPKHREPRAKSRHLTKNTP